MRVSDLRAARAAAADKLRGLLATAEAENRAFNDDEEKRFGELREEERQLERRVVAAEQVRDAELALAGERRAADGEGADWSRTLEGYNLGHALASFIPGSGVDAGRERELSQEIRSRHPGRKWRGELTIPNEIFRVPAAAGAAALETRAPNSTFRVGTGHVLSPEQYRPDLYIDLLRASLISAQLGVRVLDDLSGSGKAVIPRQTAGSTAGWVPEDGDVPVAAAAWDSLALTPKTVGVWASMSRRMLVTSTPSIEALVRADLAAAVAEGIDNALLNGNPAANAPRGLLRYAAGDGLNVVSFGTDGGPMTLANVLAMYGAPKRRNVPTSRMGWLGSARITERALQTLAIAGDAAGGFLMQPGANGLLSLAGRPYAETELDAMLNHTKGASADLAALIFGDWSEAVIGFWSGLDVIVDPYTLATAGAVRVVVMRDCDIVFRRLPAFAVGLLDVTP